ncbi:tetratricopeptide repeat-containing sensor histidine kinase [Flavobacterium fluviatile]|uniref:tetratricopeptide repeat-containing sensor histidine kinase n=1 Tax=Flavobacterium fluviatile TaxID=1862387 RepID=UPI0013D4C3E8|nr:ATP-binding protein [Flavobacterium fluviatile]
MKKYYLILLIFFIGCNRQNEGIHVSGKSKDSLDLYLSLANEYKLPVEIKQKYTRKAFEVIMSQHDDSLKRVNLFKVANRYFNMRDWNGYNKTVKIILEKSQKAKDSLSMSKAYIYLGDYYSSQASSDSAFACYYKAEKLYLEANDFYNLAKTRLSKALLQFNEGDFYGSEKAVFNALRDIKGKNNIDILYDAYNLLGVIYNELGDYEKAIEFHNKAIVSIDDKIIPVEFQSKATSLNNIGFVYQNLDDYKKANFYFKKGLEEKNLYSQKPDLYAILLDNLAYSRFKLNQNEELPDLFYKALKIRDSLQLTAGITASKMHLSEYFASIKDTAKALHYSNQALIVSKRTKNFRNVLVALKQLSLIHPKKASKFSEDYIRINDSLQKAERKMGDKFTRIEYETNEIKSENSSLEIQNRTLVYVFSILSLIGLFFYIYKTQQARNRELLFKQQQQIANEDIYNLMISQQNAIETMRIREKKKVAQELHDGVLGRMFGVRISLDSLDKLDEDTAADKRKKYLLELKEIEQDIREISHDLNKEKSGLINNFVAILEKLFQNQTNTFETQLVYNIDTNINWDLVSNVVKINLYRIIQEALQNGNKYAKAKTITVELKSEINYLVLSISDDGIGFNTHKTKKGIGLQNIEYRTAECNGNVEINSARGEGTVILVKIPIDQKINKIHNES